MPAVPSWVIEPIWDQFAALIPPLVDTHPLGCHRPRIADRIVFDKLVQVLVFGVAYAKIGDTTCSGTTVNRPGFQAASLLAASSADGPVS